MKRKLLVALATAVVGLTAVGTAAAWDKPAPPVTQTIDQGQGNESSQGQVQVVPIAPQLNVQNVNVGTGGDVQQGDANNANTGQANQQQGTQVAAQEEKGTHLVHTQSPTTESAQPSEQGQSVEQGQGNHSSQGQVQVVPIAPQANVQNVNVLTDGDVEQGDANNANTGQANQQHDTQVVVQKSSGGSPHGGCNCPAPPKPADPSISQHQGNSSTQKQIQIVPIAPQANVQNVNVLTFGDVRQGDANNANTGQANQQRNTQVAVQKGGGGPKKTDCKEPSSSGEQSVTQKQGNWSGQKQVQIVPIAPQLNLQNVNVGTHGDVRQGDVNNANTGQANQQRNTQVAVQKAGKARERSWPPTCCRSGPQFAGNQSVSQHQGNRSWHKQLQFIPIAPQLNAQNVNAFTWGFIWQGSANNANTGQANQQENRQFAFQHGGWSIA